MKFHKLDLNKYSLNDPVESSQEVSKSNFSRAPFDTSAERSNEPSLNRNLFTRNPEIQFSETADPAHVIKSVNMYSNQFSEPSSQVSKTDVSDPRRERRFIFKNQAKNTNLNFNKEFSATLSKTASKVDETAPVKTMTKTINSNSIKSLSKSKSSNSMLPKKPKSSKGKPNFGSKY